jgi:hypothetical protein
MRVRAGISLNDNDGQYGVLTVQQFYLHYYLMGHAVA